MSKDSLGASRATYDAQKESDFAKETQFVKEVVKMGRNERSLIKFRIENRIG